MSCETSIDKDGASQSILQSKREQQRPKYVRRFYQFLNLLGVFQNISLNYPTVILTTLANLCHIENRMRKTEDISLFG